MALEALKVFTNSPVRGFLLDVTGVLYNSAEGSDGVAIPGSIEAVNRLYAESRVRFLSNESTSTNEMVVAKLRRLGFTLQKSDVIMPAPVAAAFIQDRGLKPHLLVHPDVSSYFPATVPDADCVLMGDAEHEFSFHNVNEAFRSLMRMRDPWIISLGCGKFYQRVDGPTIDVGAYAEALKFATGCRHTVIGKPMTEYFQYALDSLGCKKEETVMIGDDIVSDVAGAMEFGLRAVQVRTGKWRAEWEEHAIVKPSLIADSLSAAVDAILDVHTPHN